MKRAGAAKRNARWSASCRHPRAPPKRKNVRRLKKRGVFVILQDSSRPTHAWRRVRLHTQHTANIVVCSTREWSGVLLKNVFLGRRKQKVCYCEGRGVSSFLLRAAVESKNTPHTHKNKAHGHTPQGGRQCVRVQRGSREEKGCICKRSKNACFSDADTCQRSLGKREEEYALKKREDGEGGGATAAQFKLSLATASSQK
jgi:hypothetical protein